MQFSWKTHIVKEKETLNDCQTEASIGEKKVLRPSPEIKPKLADPKMYQLS